MRACLCVWVLVCARVCLCACARVCAWVCGSVTMGALESERVCVGYRSLEFFGSNSPPLAEDEYIN